MVKSGNIIEHKVLKKGKGYGRGGTWVKEKMRLNGTVYFPEKPDGSIDLSIWYLTENEALFFEAVERDKILLECKEEIEKLYEKRNKRWNSLCDKFGVNRKIPS